MFNLYSILQLFSRIKASTPHIPDVILSQVAAGNKGGDEDKYLKTNNSPSCRVLKLLYEKSSFGNTYCDTQVEIEEIYLSAFLPEKDTAKHFFLHIVPGTTFSTYLQNYGSACIYWLFACYSICFQPGNPIFP